MEMWKDIPGYEGLYQASDLGNIRSAPNKVTSNARYGRRVWKSRVMKFKEQKSGGRGDLRVSLWKDGSQKDFLVARLVALAWCDGFCDGMTVNHKGGNFKNNRPSNLEWVSLEDNIRHGFRTGLYEKTQRQVKLVSEVTGEIVFPSMSDASRYCGKSHGYVSDAIGKGRKVRDLDGNVYVAVPF